MWSAENEDGAYFERADLDTHDTVVVLGRNYHVVNYSERIKEVNPFIPNYKALKFPIVHDFIQYDDPY